jgi:hypothetical protein
MIMVWQNVWDTPFLCLYIRALFKSANERGHTPIDLPRVHTPFSFTGTLVNFQDSELVVQVDDHSHFQKREHYSPLH